MLYSKKYLSNIRLKAIGQNIRTLRRQKGWSQEDIAMRLGISIPAFSKIETGVTDVNLSRIEQIAAAFEVSIIELLTLDEPNQHRAKLDLEVINKKLLSREIEVIELQKKVIELFEQLKISQSK
ncbi:MAG: anaerobic benzoate catabolism transcriptional regulator [Mucilaginibacter sp.]|nr:anaerobic benzoate catabolism transcriptional regulator [Mucilaginibacter sp.]